MEILNSEFLGNIIVMIIGLVILGVGAEVFIAGAYASTFNYYLTVILMAAGLVLIAFGLRLLFDLIDHIHPNLRHRA